MVVCFENARRALSSPQHLAVAESEVIHRYGFRVSSRSNLVHAFQTAPQQVSIRQKRNSIYMMHFFNCRVKLSWSAGTPTLLPTPGCTRRRAFTRRLHRPFLYCIWRWSILWGEDRPVVSRGFQHCCRIREDVDNRSSCHISHGG